MGFAVVGACGLLVFPGTFGFWGGFPWVACRLGWVGVVRFGFVGLVHVVLDFVFAFGVFCWFCLVVGLFGVWVGLGRLFAGVGLLADRFRVVG